MERLECEYNECSKRGNEKLHVITHNYFGSKAKVVWDFSFFRAESTERLQSAGLVYAVPGVCHQNICFN